MALTPETLSRHELNGLPVRVVDSTDRTRVGIEGSVVAETMRTLSIRRGSDVVRVPKAGTTLEFALTDEAAGARKGAGSASKPSVSAGTDGDGATYVTVDGATLLSRPARRTEHGGTTLWH